MAIVTMRQLLEAGVHFGHQTRRWNPKMKRFIFGERNGIYIIDLNQTLVRIEQAYTFVRDMVAEGGTILFVGTKKQTQDPIADAANKCGMPYVNERWLGGMLTNFSTITARVKKMQDYERMREAGDFEAMPKKEALILSRELEKLQRNLGGLRGLSRMPDAVFIIDTKKEHIAVTEANKLGMPIVAVVDTNCDPDLIQYVIPGNDDAIRAGTLMCRVISDAVIEGQFIASRRNANKSAAAAASRPAPSAQVAADPEAHRVQEQAEARRQAALQAREREARLAASRRTTDLVAEGRPGPADDPGGPPAVADADPGGAASAPASQEPPPGLYWNSRFPEHPSLTKRGELATVEVGSVYRFETAIEHRADSDGKSSPIDADIIIGRSVVFELLGTGVSFQRIPDEPFSDFAESNSTTCTTSGTPPFQVACRIDRVGELSIDARLIVRNAKLLDQHIKLRGVASASSLSSGIQPPSLKPPESRIDAGALSEMPDVQLRLAVTERTPNSYSMDASTTVGSQMRAVSMASSVRALHSAAADARRRLATLSKSYHLKADGGAFEIENAGDLLLEFAQIGASLHRDIFGLPTAEGNAAGKLAVLLSGLGRDVGRRWQMQIDATDIGVPWSLLYDGLAYGASIENSRTTGGVPYGRLPERPEDVDLSCFWGYRFNIFHAFTAHDFPSEFVGTQTIKAQPVLNPGLGAFSANQRALFSNGASSGVAFEDTVVIDTCDSFLRWVASGEDAACDVLYFFCHAWAPSAYEGSGIPSVAHNPRDAYFGLEGRAGIDTYGQVNLHQIENAWSQMRPRRPLVFLHACGSSRDDSLYGRPFVEHFLGTWGGRALFGTEWPVPAAFADVFGSDVLDTFRTPGVRIIDAIRAASDTAYAQGNVFPLVYSLFGRCDLRTRTP